MKEILFATGNKSKAKRFTKGLLANDIKVLTLEDVPINIEVEDDVTFMSFAAVTKDPDATVTGNDFTALNYGDNTIMITVTAEDGVTTRTITVNIYRKKVAISGKRKYNKVD